MREKFSWKMNIIWCVASGKLIKVGRGCILLSLFLCLRIDSFGIWQMAREIKCESFQKPEVVLQHELLLMFRRNGTRINAVSSNVRKDPTKRGKQFREKK